MRVSFFAGYNETSKKNGEKDMNNEQMQNLRRQRAEEARELLITEDDHYFLDRNTDLRASHPGTSKGGLAGLVRRLKHKYRFDLKFYKFCGSYCLWVYDKNNPENNDAIDKVIIPASPGCYYQEPNGLGDDKVAFYIPRMQLLEYRDYVDWALEYFDDGSLSAEDTLNLIFKAKHQFGYSGRQFEELCMKFNINPDKMAQQVKGMDLTYYINKFLVDLNRVPEPYQMGISKPDSIRQLMTAVKDTKEDIFQEQNSYRSSGLRTSGRTWSSQVNSRPENTQKDTYSGEAKKDTQSGEAKSKNAKGPIVDLGIDINWDEIPF